MALLSSWVKQLRKGAEALEHLKGERSEVSIDCLVSNIELFLTLVALAIMTFVNLV